MDDFSIKLIVVLYGFFVLFSVIVEADFFWNHWRAVRIRGWIGNDGLAKTLYVILGILIIIVGIWII